MNNFINESEIRRFWDVEKRNGILTEIRLIAPDGKIASGYFRNIENLLEGLRSFPGYGVYYTINRIKDDCYGRIQCEKFVIRPKQTTTDNDILGRDMVVMDIDPVRSAGVNASEEELNYAKAKANEIYKFLRDAGFYPPIVNISANGVHLKLRCSMKNTDENTLVVKNFLSAMDMMFSDEKVSVDISLSNAARILKVCGTPSLKGNDNPASDRPRRMAYYVKIPDDWIENVNTNEYFQKVAAMLPEKEQPTYSNNYSTGNFDIEAFIQKHGIKVARKVVTERMTKWVLEECPFDANHKAPDSAIFRMADGSLGFCCLHNSHKHLTFKDLRIKFEPDAYTKKDYAESLQRQNYYRPYGRQPFQPKKENDDNGKKWKTALDIQRVDVSQIPVVNTGFLEIDKYTWGMFMGDVTILSGTSGSGKSSYVNCLIANLVERNVKVGLVSCELQDFRVMSWLYQTAAGKTYVKKKEGYENWYYAPKDICDKIDVWLADRLFIYNNNYGTNFFQIFSDVNELVDNNGVNVVIIDNLATLDLSEYEGSDLEKQTRFISDMKEYAKRRNIHVIIVAHPKKLGQELNRKESVSGSNNLTNLADVVLIVNRKSLDYQKRLIDFMGAEKANEYDQFDTVIEIAKSRMSGQIDKFCGLFFEMESRRLKNYKAEHIVYGWNADPVQQRMKLAAQAEAEENGENVQEDDYYANDDALPFVPEDPNEGGACPF
jgi:archaellum biogenesis ATPase FlaH